MNRAATISAMISHALENKTIDSDDASRILLRLASISKGLDVDDNFPEMVQLHSMIMRYYGEQNPFFVVCLEIDPVKEGSELEYVLATRQQFANEADARAYASTIAESREPMVLRVVPA